MVRSATLTTVPSRNAIPEPRTAAAMTARPVGSPHPNRLWRRTRHTSTGSLAVVSTRRRGRSRARLVEHVDRLAVEHPPIDLATVDFTVREPGRLRARASATSSTTWPGSSSRSTATCSS